MRESHACLLVRPDVGTAVGLGHAMRSLALAGAWVEAGGHASLMVDGTAPEGLVLRAREEGVAVERASAPAGSLEDAAAIAAVAGRLGARVVHLDGYCFPLAHQQTLRRAAPGVTLSLADDNGENHEYAVDVVLNQNAHADGSFYARATSAPRLLMGTQYALLRREFLAAPPGVPRSEGRQLLVTLGGSDIEGHTLTAVRALRGVPADVTVVAGSLNPHHEEIAREAPSHWSVLRAVADMTVPMRACDVALTAAGSTCLELAYLGIPMATVVLAENQRRVATAFAAAGAAVELGGPDALMPDGARVVTALLQDVVARRSLSAAGRTLVDGRGAARVVAALREREASRR